MAIKYITEAEKRAELSRQKYGAMTMGEILSRVIVWLLIGYLIIVIVCIILYLSPVPDRMLSTVLLVFVLVEMLTEFGLWAFTYQGMRKTEAPLQDLQQFSAITKEGWKRAEMVMDWTAPLFAWLDGILGRSGMNWRKNHQDNTTVTVVPPEVRVIGENPPPSAKEMKEMLDAFTHAMQEVSGKLDKIVEVQAKKE